MAAEGLAVGHSLWLVPAEPEHRRLARWIDRLAARLGTPRFEPHLTLLGGFDAEAAWLARLAESLAAMTPALDLRLGPPGHGERFLRCVYAPVEPSPGLAAAHARARARLAFFDAREPFFPHVSLVYASLPAAARQALASELAPELSGLALACRELWLVRTQGRCEEWRVLGRLPLRPPASRA